ncbi:hypothetical protein DPMN_107251 [Dreissena polymorpha]|uniref:Uncharacterized protein n=1 Tax=Dreissena polymorpha TaxID=45954 RepID=A0A9D4K6L0_DREPO|nr:hypothetical protein DPMN_107251 [Dreissena polymorpha]
MLPQNLSIDQSHDLLVARQLETLPQWRSIPGHLGGYSARNTSTVEIDPRTSWWLGSWEHSHS